MKSNIVQHQPLFTDLIEHVCENIKYTLNSFFVFVKFGIVGGKCKCFNFEMRGYNLYGVCCFIERESVWASEIYSGRNRWIKHIYIKMNISLA